ncbi:MAG: hypothetical protein R3E44_03265 [Paracoccaceae bacterium]
MFHILFHPITLAGSALFACLPWRWTWRVAVTMLLALLLAFRLEPPYHDPGIGYVLALAIMAVVLAAWSAALAARGVYELWRRTRHGPRLARGDAPVLRWFDRALIAGYGAFAAFLVFLALGWVAEGAGHGYLWHAVLFVAGLGAALAAIRLGRGPLRSLTAFGLALAALSVWGAVVFPGLVRASAETIAGDAPYCVALMNRGRPPASAEELTFLTMDKAFGHHAILLVGTPEGPTGHHWSYHFRAFRTGLRNPSLDEAIPCIPHARFFETLRPAAD